MLSADVSAVMKASESVVLIPFKYPERVLPMKVNETSKWCLALAIAVLLFYWKLFFPSQFTLLDGVEAVRQGYSWLHFWMRSVRAGSLPMWDPYALAGYSFPGEMQTGAFYPLYFLLLLLPLNSDGLMSSMQYNCVILSAHVLATLFMFALAREFKLSHFAPFISAFCFSVGSFTGRVTWPHMLGSSIWLPLIFLFLLRALNASELARRLAYSLLSGCVLGLSLLAGGLHIAMAQTIVVLTAAAYYAVSCRAESKQRIVNPVFLRSAQVAGTIVLAGFCVASVQLLSSHIYASRSIRFLGPFALPSLQIIPYVNLTGSEISTVGLLSVLFPLADGLGKGEIWSPYIGALPFLFACIAIAKCWSSLWVRYLAGLSLLAMLYAMGENSVLHGLVYALIPWIWMAREATRFIYLTGFGLAVLAGFGVDAFSVRSLPETFWSVLRIALTRVMLGCVIVLGCTMVWPRPGLFWILYSVLLILAACGTLRFGLAKHYVSPSWRWVAIGLIFFDLGAFNWTVSDKIAADRENRNDLSVLTSLKGVAQFLKSRPGVFRASVLRDPAPNLGDAFGVQTTAGAGVTFDNYFDAVRGNLELLNSKYFIRPATFGDPNPVYQDTAWKIYENRKAFPRSWLVHESKVEPDDSKVFRSLGQSNLDLHKFAFVSAPLPSEIRAESQGAGEAVSIRSYEANRITTVVHAEKPALLVFSELFCPGWYATVNGKEAPIYRANGAFRSVLVPGGDSTVELRYRPWPVYIGSVLCVATCLTTVLSFVLLRRKPQLP